jgi:hypothetical protein
MSNFDQKVEVVTDFLVSRARLGRFTTYSEVGYIAGQMLNDRGYRSTGSSRVVARGKVVDVLAQIAARSVADDGFILPAIVLHANDNGTGHRFAEWALQNGVMTEDDSVLPVHFDQVRKVFSHYGGLKQLAALLIDPLPEIPNDLSGFTYSVPQSNVTNFADDEDEDDES